MNPMIENVGGSTIRALHARRKPTSINLGMGEPTLMPDMRHFDYASRWVAENGCRYSTNIGDADLREAIAKHYAYPGLDVADNVCIMTGSQEAVYIAIKTLLDPARDELLLVEPAFPVYAKVAEIEGIALRRVVMPESSGFRFDADAILSALGPNTRMIVLCSPCNPTGRVIDRAAGKKIADALLARSGPPVYILHDEIYRELTYTPDAAEFGKIYPYTIAINSLSKSNAMTGMRLGWLFAPADAMPQIVKMHGWATSCANTYAQRIAYDIFVSNDLATQQPWYARQREGALGAARDAGLECIEPDAAFYLCLKVGAKDTLRFVESLIDERDVVAVPGHIFATSLRGWVRTSFVGPMDAIREGYRRIAEHARAWNREGAVTLALR
ncbi:MAG: pyridoxal phosphate-dependent aminotransferase [Candidatus Eremiobacteraeota bacterium]|nr:pyridoxal phosphate-dependent aminotransferase [Candidatus Eremiobacteraeota bacterium]